MAWLLCRSRLKEIKVYQSDNCLPICPPYSSSGELASVKTLNQWGDNGEGPFDYQQTLKYFQAVSEEKNIAAIKSINQAIDKRQFHTGGAAIMYLVSGMK